MLIYTILCNFTVFRVILNDLNITNAIIVFLIGTTGNLAIPAFMFGFYSFLYRVELFYDHILVTKRQNIPIVLKLLFYFLRRSPIKIVRGIGRAGSSGLSFLNGAPPPRGSRNQLVTWGVVTVTGIAIYEYRKHHDSLINADVQKHKTDRKWDNRDKDNDTKWHEISKHNDRQWDERTKHNDREWDERTKHNDRQWDDYNRDKARWNNQSSWTRGKPPTPPTYK
jgi:hypothetical protein